MAMLGGSCSKCCGGLKCYVPANTHGACCKLDGTCSIEAECDCDTDSGEIFNVGEGCESCPYIYLSCEQTQKGNLQPYSRRCTVTYSRTELLTGATPEISSFSRDWEKYIVPVGGTCGDCCLGGAGLRGIEGYTHLEDLPCDCCIEGLGSGYTPSQSLSVLVRPLPPRWTLGDISVTLSPHPSGCGSYAGQASGEQGENAFRVDIYIGRDIGGGFGGWGSRIEVVDNIQSPPDTQRFVYRSTIDAIQWGAFLCGHPSWTSFGEGFLTLEWSATSSNPLP